jgi:hypothetical protein
VRSLAQLGDVQKFSGALAASSPIPQREREREREREGERERENFIDNKIDD